MNDIERCLSSINNIDSTVYQASHYVEEQYIHLYDKLSLMDDIEDRYNNIELMSIQESVGGKVKDFFSKVIDLIKRFFSFIGRMIKKIFNALFGKRRMKKTPDQVAADNIKTTPTKVVGEVSWEDFQKSTKVHFPADPSSAIKETDLTIITKSLVINIENNDYVIGTPHGFKGDLYENAEKSFAHNGKTNDEDVNLFLAFISNHEGFRDSLNDMIDFVLEHHKEHITDDMLNEFGQKNQQVLDRQKKILSKTDWTYRFNSSLAKTYQGSVNDLVEKLTSVSNTVENVNPQYKSFLNSLVRIMNHIQYGCNGFAVNVKAMYMIDEKYLHTISDLDTLGKFVNELIAAGVPTTYVAYNTWCVMSENFEERRFFMYSDKYKTNIRFPRWGQTRVVFFPDNTPHEVLKIALNAAGRLANKREFQIYRQYQKYNVSNLLAKPINDYAYYAISVMEKLETFRADEHMVRSMEYEIKKLREEHPELADIHDIHSGNLGVNEGESHNVGNLKIIDYAS